MTATHGGRPLPWHDTPLCRLPGCGLHMVPVPRSLTRELRCSGCDGRRTGSVKEWKQALKSQEAWFLKQQGLVHGNRGCARCGAVLRLDRERLCVPCVEVDMRERQQDMFPAAGGQP